MAFFDKIGDKAKGLVDSAKITYKVSEEKSKLSELYEHLGLLVWEAHQNDAEPPAELVPVFDRIREIHASIEKLTAELSSVKSKINTNTNGNSDSNGECCCGSDESSTEFAEDSFDNRSGDAANEYECSREDFHAVDGTIKCPSCGRQIDKLSAFCPCCGNKLPVDDSAKPDCSAKRYCAACGSELNSAAAFCPHCGAKN